MTKRKIIVLLVIIVPIVFFLIRFTVGKRRSREISIETMPAAISRIQNMVTATGTLEPIEKVAVGTQVSGVIKKIHVDFNSVVKKGDLLAELDKTLLKSQIRQSKASLRAAENEMNFQKKNYDRIHALFEREMVSREDLDKAEYSYEQATVSFEKAQADLERAVSNLSYATIYSPINGIVLSRAVDEGQTVAASLNAPTLFTIARDLTGMEVRANVDEADIGQVKQGQRVEFTVDAYPEKTFQGKVSQVRLEPVVVSNVVTYTITVEAENPDLLLLPGMTASITIYTREAEDILVIPSKALRFRPDREMMRRYEKQHGFLSDSGKGFQKKSNRGDGFPAERRSEPSKEQARIWIMENERIKPVRIKTGISDGTKTEVREGIEEGTKVIVAMNQQALSQDTGNDGAAGSNNPFMPRFNRRRSTRK